VPEVSYRCAKDGHFLKIFVWDITFFQVTERPYLWPSELLTTTK